MEETWLYHHDPETKLLGLLSRSMTMKRPSFRTPKKYKASRSTGKIIGSLFWDNKPVVMIEYLDCGDTVRSSFYAEQIKKLHNKIGKIRRGKEPKTVLFYQDNISVHKSALAVIGNTGFEILEHSPYLSDHAPHDFYLFSRSKEYLNGNRFEDDEA
ncbi:Histone-lysine N-methyltransferase SETMAR [Eumeta japonica]|uniref:Histone-lysine N-methyltransferase SETMAR n=1 Tax=Eumeta variegata TaxID=151549 RepID=A0A4C1TC37_EUMVA|nr:Histone-lysine N-methyltransferase SETMAR [Eumeta japonica]